MAPNGNSSRISLDYHLSIIKVTGQSYNHSFDEDSFMMICYCLIQEGQISQEDTQRLATGIENIVEKHLASGVNLSWVVIPKGNGWKAGEPSTSSLVLLTTPDIEQAARIDLLGAIRDLWTEVTGCSVDEIMINAPPLASLVA